MAEILENKTCIKIDDLTYRLEETLDAMSQSMMNLRNVKDQQIALLNLVRVSDQAEEFKEFLEESEEQLTRLNEQEAKLYTKIELLKQVIDAAKANEEIAKTTTLLLMSLGVFDNR